MEANGKVFVLHAAGKTEAELRELRDYVLESLAVGVIVLGSGMSYKLEDVPELGGAVIRADVGLLREHSAAPEPGKRRGRSPKPPAGAGQEYVEKNRILERLKRYREKNGLGCLAAVAVKTGRLSQEDLRAMLNAERKFEFSDYLLVDRALDKVEGTT